VLSYVVADLLYDRFPEATEGELTSQRVSLVRAERLVRWARSIGLGDYLYLGQGERVSESARDRMLAGAFEALIGAILLDRGLREARRFIRRFVEADLATVLAGLAVANPKGRLQELLQEEYRVPPVYQTISAEGPAHDRIFTVEVTIEGRRLGLGSGSSKRDAEQAAAASALATIELDHVETAAPPQQQPTPTRRGRSRPAS
jgi:ribonuclease-3